MFPFTIVHGIEKKSVVTSSLSQSNDMTTFVSIHFPVSRKSFHDRHVVQRCTPKRTSIRRRSTLRAATDRAEVLSAGIEAALEDHLITGMNIGIGDGSKEILVPMLDSIASMVAVERVIDVAFLGTCRATRLMLEERNLPNDLSVNYKKEIDLFIAPVSRVDGDCNAILDSSEFGGARYAAQMARKVVLLTHEDDLRKCQDGLDSIPVQLVDFLPEMAAKSLFSDSLFAAGVRGISLREGKTNIADVTLARNSSPLMVVEELTRLAQVQSVGLLPAYDKTTVVVSTTDLQPFDITPIGYSLARSNQSSMPLSPDKLRKELSQLDEGWAVSDNGSCGLQREFMCMSCEAAEALIRYVHFLTRNGGRFAELKQVGSKVFIGLGEHRSELVHEVDLLMAKALTKTYTNLSKSQQ